MTQWPACLLMVAVLVGGCLGLPAESPAEQPVPAEGNASSTTALGAPNLYLEGCDGGFVLMRVPDALLQNAAPSAWSGENGAIFYLNYYFFTCQRVGWGDIERGPVSFVLEAEGIAGYPESCVPQGAPNPYYIHAVYSDDKDFGERLARAMFTKFYLSQHSLDPGSATSGAHGKLSWQPAGFPESSVIFVPNADQLYPTEYTWVFIAPGDNASVRLVIDAEVVKFGLDVAYGLADLAEPTLVGPQFESPLPASVIEARSMQQVGTFTYWENESCEPSRNPR